MTPTLVNGICSEVENMTEKMPTNYEYFHATLDLDWEYNDAATTTTTTTLVSAM